MKGSEVWVAPTRTRVVPLKHYAYMALPQSSFKKETDKSLVSEMRSLLSKLLLLKDNAVPFHHQHHKSLKKIKKYVEDTDLRVRRSFVINNGTQLLEG